MVITTSGKDQADMTKPEIKLSAYMTVMPIAQTPTPVTPPGGGGDGSTPPGQEPTGSDDNGSSIGGCSATNSSSGLATFLLIGLAAFARRRRS